MRSLIFRKISIRITIMQNVTQAPDQCCVNLQCLYNAYTYHVYRTLLLLSSLVRLKPFEEEWQRLLSLEGERGERNRF